ISHNFLFLQVINCGDLDSYPLLQYLDLSFSHIEHIEDDALGRLEILEILMLDHNKLSKVPISLPISLEHLFLQNNDIMEIPQQAFQGLNNLKTLDLSHNKLLYLPDIMLPKLQTLNLQSSEIRGISQGIIHSLPKLNDLMLEDNPIKCADLLGIAEWASTCRLRVEKEQEGEDEQDEQENFVIKIQDLKNKFEKMHNFYEQFGLNTSTLNNRLLNDLKPPACVQENSVQNIVKNQNLEIGDKKKFKSTSLALNKPLEETNFNQNSMNSSPLLSTTTAATVEKTSRQHNNNQTDTERRRKAVESVEELQQKLEDETAVKTITIENPIQTLPATMQSSILNEKQTPNTTTKSFNSNATTTTTVVASTSVIATISNKLKTAGNEGPEEEDIVVKPTFTNEMKTFDHLTANADAVATTTSAAVIQQHEIASIGNTPTVSSSNMTEVVKAVLKHTKEAEQQLEDVQHRTTFRTKKSKKWLKQTTPLKGGDDIEMPQNMEILLKQDKTKDINAAQFIKSTTFATPINSETQATTIVPPTPTSAALTTTTMAEAFIQTKQENKLVKDAQRWAGEGVPQEKDVDVLDFESTTSKLEINLERNEKQQHEIKTKNATTKEIKSSATINPKSMQTKLTDTVVTTTATTIKALLESATTNKRISEKALIFSPELTANLEKPNKELNGFTQTTHSITTTTNSHLSTTQTMTKNFPNNKTTTTATKSTTDKPLKEEKHAVETTTSTTAAILKTFKTIEPKTTATTIPTTLVKDKDLASNYNDKNRQISKTINKNNKILIETTTNSNITSSTIITSSTTTSGNNKNNQIAKTFDITTTNSTASAATTMAINNIVDHQQQQQQQQHNPAHISDIVMPHYHQSLEKDVNVKCMQSNSNECNSAVTTTTTSSRETQNELGRTPTMEDTLEQTIVSKTTTEIPTATSETTTVIHKHEPIQLLVKDRHLIGTPLLMHKGENLMVTADELILPNNNHNAEQEDDNNNNNSKAQHDLETNTMASDNKNKQNLELSQTTGTPATVIAATKTTLNKPIKIEHNINKSTNKKGQEDIKLEDPAARQDDLGKIQKPNYEMKTKKPSLIMKKMTIITKQHEAKQYNPAAEPLENEVHAKQFDNSHYQELKPLATTLEKDDSQTHSVKHSTVNTPINSNNKNQDNRQAANLLQQPHTFQHEHELLIQQILQDQQAETHAKLTKTEQWSDLRRAESKENHPGLILLVSSGLFLVLLLGLMHVYRCDMPWRRHSPSYHLRPHQRQNHTLDDDSHSFLSYSEGMQKWHHSTRLEAPYNSPLHNLHVRELQKTSATEKPATVKTSATNFKPQPLSHSIVLNNSRSLSQSSTTTTSTASASSSAILDDESFYIEMTPDSGQFAQAMQSELLPMELLNLTQIQTVDYQDAMGDSQTSMEDECVVHYKQQPQQRYQPHLSALTSSSPPSLPCSTSSPSRTTPILSVKPQIQSRKFGLW
ncbi:DEP domain-containing protein DDB_G0279099-like, partial [Lucilia sericata]|uniref:DEP domain-containing protein DDB_G0279099-like n=1 Tax=Lucilia sericata TaxID=13632 RepID=UPI0018A824C0